MNIKASKYDSKLLTLVKACMKSFKPQKASKVITKNYFASFPYNIIPSNQPLIEIDQQILQLQNFSKTNFSPSQNPQTHPKSNQTDGYKLKINNYSPEMGLIWNEELLGIKL